jgi:hypothetical protein
MAWGHFSAAHWISLVAVAMIFACLYFGLRKASQTVQNIVLGILSFSGMPKQGNHNTLQPRNIV